MAIVASYMAVQVHLQHLSPAEVPGSGTLLIDTYGRPNANPQGVVGPGAGTGPEPFLGWSGWLRSPIGPRDV